MLRIFLERTYLFAFCIFTGWIATHLLLSKPVEGKSQIIATSDTCPLTAFWLKEYEAKQCTLTTNIGLSELPDNVDSVTLFERKIRNKKNIDVIVASNPYKQTTEQQRVKAFLKTISWAEGADYNIGFGYNYVNDLSKHPCRVWSSSGYKSSAFGAYQVLCSTWKHTVKQLRKKGIHIKDASPLSQDTVAIELLHKRGILKAIKKDNIPKAMHLASWEWASFPCVYKEKTKHRYKCKVTGRSRYGQPSRTLNSLLAKYNELLDNNDYQLAMLGD